MNHDSTRVAYLFGKAYWWDTDPDGRLTLQPAVWINAPALRNRLAGTTQPGIVAPWPPTRIPTPNT